MNTDMIKLSEVLEKVNGFLNEQITQDELNEWCKVIKFRLKLNTREKCEAINNIIYNMPFSSEFVESFIELEMYKFWYGLLAYTNIDISDNSLLTEDNYNIINLFLYDWILSYVKADYEIFTMIFDKMWGYVNTTAVAEAMIETIAENSQKEENLNEEFFNYIKENPDTINQLSKIATMGTNIVLPKTDSE